MDTPLNGLHALVCGSTQGIGRATAITLANAGAAITLLGPATDVNNGALTAV